MENFYSHINVLDSASFVGIVQAIANLGLLAFFFNLSTRIIDRISRRLKIFKPRRNTLKSALDNVNSAIFVLNQINSAETGVEKKVMIGRYAAFCEQIGKYLEVSRDLFKLEHHGLVGATVTSCNAAALSLERTLAESSCDDFSLDEAVFLLHGDTQVQLSTSLNLCRFTYYLDKLAAHYGQKRIGLLDSAVKSDRKLREFLDSFYGA